MKSSRGAERLQRLSKRSYSHLARKDLIKFGEKDIVLTPKGSSLLQKVTRTDSKKKNIWDILQREL